MYDQNACYIYRRHIGLFTLIRYNTNLRFRNHQNGQAYLSIYFKTNWMSSRVKFENHCEKVLLANFATHRIIINFIAQQFGIYKHCFIVSRETVNVNQSWEIEWINDLKNRKFSNLSCVEFYKVVSCPKHLTSEAPLSKKGKRKNIKASNFFFCNPPSILTKLPTVFDFKKPLIQLLSCNKLFTTKLAENGTTEEGNKLSIFASERTFRNSFQNFSLSMPSIQPILM